MAKGNKALLGDLLKATSRSFYLTLNVLPTRVRPQIGLAYLLARTTDTIADTEIVPPGQRYEALQNLRERILGHTSAPLHFDEFVRQQGSPAEKSLLEKVEESLLMLKKFPEADRKLIRDVLALITGAQQMDLHRFEKRPPEKSSRWRRRPTWTITPIAWPAAWANSGRRSAARTCFRKRGWTTRNFWWTVSALAKDCNW